MSMMTSLIWKYMDSPKKQISKYLESETYINDYDMAKNSFLRGITFDV